MVLLALDKRILGDLNWKLRYGCEIPKLSIAIKCEIVRMAFVKVMRDVSERKAKEM